jgi:hypothetical protein
MIGAIISAVGNVAGSWVKGKADEAKAKQEVRKAQENAKLKIIENEGSWEKLMAEGSKDSWKDEWFTIILSIPLVGAFIPDFVPYIMAGFEALQQTPEWYQWAVMAAISASFGIRGISKFKGLK